MHNKSPFAALLRKTILLLAPLCLTIPVHFSHALTVQLVTTFDYPGAVSTTPTGINDRGEVAGFFVQSNKIHGFIRNRDGTFRPPLTEPNDNDNATVAFGINNSRLVCGYYRHLQFGEATHGFFFSGHTYTEFDLPGALDTWIYGLNDAGDFVGDYVLSGGAPPFYGYVNVSGTTTTFQVPQAVSYTIAVGINNAGEIVGTYDARSGGNTYSYGFFRDASGTLTYPLEVLPDTGTYLADINDNGQIVGQYGTYNDMHGLLMNVSGSYITYDYPGAEITSLNGINNAGLICGSYAGRQNHGFLARVVR